MDQRSLEKHHRQHAAGYRPGSITGGDMYGSPPADDSDSTIDSNRTRGRPSPSPRPSPRPSPGPFSRPSPKRSPRERSTDGRLSFEAQRLDLNAPRPDLPSPGQKRNAPSDGHHGPRGGSYHQSQKRRIGGTSGSRAALFSSAWTQGRQAGNPVTLKAPTSKNVPPVAQHMGPSDAKRNDSGYVSGPSRANTIQMPGPATRFGASGPTIQNHVTMLKEPDQATITKEQLAAEVKGIYTGLVMVEAKCINIDAAQANEHKRESLSSDQWQALIALHRTLLYEHHDFLMATQHPSATDTLKNLAIKYSMPARMWKHSIHAFLEVLRHRRPESQEYMLQFIYFAYSMMALLYETVPSFKDTWIECLGDLARYRMAVEEDKEAHSLWGMVAARWYHLAADRDPKIGRLNHHLGILERPSLRKLFFYMKSLTCEVPFQNARDSLTTVCNPIVKDPHILKNSQKSTEACLVTMHALLFRKPDAQEIIDDVQKLSIAGLQKMELSKFKAIGASLAIVTVSIMLGIGEHSDPLFDLYFDVLTKEAHGGRSPQSNASQKPVQQSLTTNTLSEKHVVFAQQCIIAVFSRVTDESSVRDTAPFCVVILAFYQSLSTLREKAPGEKTDKILAQVLGGLLGKEVRRVMCNQLNKIVSLHGGRVNREAHRCAREKVFLENYSANEIVEVKVERTANNTLANNPQHPPAPERRKFLPTPEDYQLVGIAWVKWYFVVADGSKSWFPETEADDTRNLETEQIQSMRLLRCLWSGLFIAFHAPDFWGWDEKEKCFSVAAQDAAESTERAVKVEAVAKAERAVHNTVDYTRDDALTDAISSHPPTHSPTSTNTWSATSETTEEGFAMVKARKLGVFANAHRSNKFIGPIKEEQKVGGVTIADSEDMDWQKVEHE